VSVNITATIPEKAFNKKDVIEYQPIIKYKDGQKELKKITLLGEKAVGEGEVIYAQTGGKVNYSDVFDFEPGMEASELWTNTTFLKKGKNPTLLEPIKLADGVINTSQHVYHDENIFNADRETAELLNMDVSGYYELETIISKQAKIFFLINKYNLNWRLPLNKDEQNKEVLEEFKAFIAQGWEIRDIDVNAWASPDGEEAFNEGLSQNRAETGQKYMTKLLDSETEVKFNTKAHGEDWDGFMKMVEKSDLEDKNAILNVVRSQADVTKREEEIRNMTVVYKEIADDILPSLRRAVLKVNCFEPKRTAEEIARLAVTNPEELNDKELLYAGTLTEDLDTKLKIYKSYMTLYPNDWKGYNNAAWVQLTNWELEEAATFLAKADELSSNNPMVVNNLGALASKEKDYDKAAGFYNDAKKLGAPEGYNLGIVSIINGDYDKALNLFGSKKCNYNVALAKMLTGNTNGAKTDLDCAEENAKVNYLKAIIGARTDNARMVYDNLAKTIEVKEKYKTHIAEDREFINYFNEEEFQNLVK
jgi:outer membrane protein OmpA-like peptidoglycan-associated protein